MQTVSRDTAERLLRAGLKHKFQWGDALCEMVFGPTDVSLFLDETASTDGCIWLPRLDQVMEEIRRQVDVAEIIFGDGHCTVLELKDPDDKSPGLSSWEGEGLNDTEAVGIALAKIMEAQNEKV